MAALQDIEAEIIVVDNGSTDGSRTFFANRFPRVTFFFNDENKGFGAANNQALQHATGEYVLFLNPDTLLPEDSIRNCIAFLQSKQNHAASGIRMIDGSGRFLKESKRAFPDPLTSLYKLTGLTRMFPRSKTFAKYYLGHLDDKHTHEVDVLAGAFMMVPRQVLEKVTGFDEDFFMYGEDIDLSYRIQQAGFINYYFAGSTIVHFKGESTRKGSLNYVKMFYTAMSIFVKKHYGSSRAGVYQLFIQTGIALRAMLSGVSRFLRWVGMPIIDILTILLCFWLVKQAWVTWLLPYLAYDNRIMLVTYPAYTFLFLTTSYYSGLYDNGYRQSRLNKSVLISTLILFTLYALVPNSEQFSRGVLLCSVALAFVMMTAVRILLVSLKVISKKKRFSDHKLAIAGTSSETEKALTLLGQSKDPEAVLGRISPGDPDDQILSDWHQLPELLHSGVLDEIIYCQGQLTFKQIIQSLEQLPPGIDAGFFAAGSSSIIGSSDKNFAGEFHSGKEYYRLQNPLYRRIKRLLDAGISLLLLLTFPVHLLIRKRPVPFFKNCFQVLFAKKTFVGYAVPDPDLPHLKQSVISTTGLPKSLNTLPVSALRHSDILYAKHYSVFTDLALIYQHYGNLSAETE